MRRPALARIGIPSGCLRSLGGCSELGIGPQQPFDTVLRPYRPAADPAKRRIDGGRRSAGAGRTERTGDGSPESPTGGAEAALGVRAKNAKAKDERQNSLMIFLDGQRNEGYLWFSSKELLDARP